MDTAAVTAHVTDRPADAMDLDALLRLFAFDDTEALWWRGKDGAQVGPLEFYVPVNDVFFWGSSDLELITASDVADLAIARTDCGDHFGYWPTLWACRKRGMRPQGAQYDYLPKHLWPLFNACGPEREIDAANPEAQE